MAEYVLEGPRWGAGPLGTSGGTLSWAIDSSVPASFVGKLEAAFADWSAHANIGFQRIASTAAAQISFVDSSIDGPNNILGQANYTYSGQSYISASITFDSGEGWHASGSEVISSSGANLFIVALHEIGHVLGLDHYNAVPAVMNTYLDLSVKDLSASDIGGIQALYGARPAPVIYGTSGDDVINVGNGLDGPNTSTVFAGSGNDQVTMKGAKAAFSAVGGDGADTITVQNTGTTFIAGGNVSGSDQSLDGADSITVDGSGGTIAIFSNLGNDIVSATGLQNATSIQIYGGRGSDTITEANLSTTGKNSIFIAGGEDGDTIAATGNGGALTIFGGISSADSADGADSITIGNGSTGTLNLFANGGNDTVVIGTLGADATTTATVYGGGGNDTITVAAQTATSQALTVSGNDGADTFSIAKGAGQTITIADFRPSEGDTLKLTGFGGSPGTLQAAGGSYQTLQDALNAAAGASSGSAAQSKAAAVAFGGSTYVVIDNTAGTGFQSTDQAIKLTGVTDLAGLVGATTIAA